MSEIVEGVIWLRRLSGVVRGVDTVVRRVRSWARLRRRRR
jgi:hypothetical protein